MQGTELLAKDGPIARQLKAYEPRSSQLQMAAAVDAALSESDARLLVEAGTGVGKSLAYLAPALCSSQRVVVATGTKALQDQLASKDAPLVVKALRDSGQKDPAVVVVKGRNNYLCLLRFERQRQQLHLPGMGADALGDAIEDWSQSSQTGDRAELDFLPDSWAPWQDIDAGSETCVGSKCPYHDECFIVRLRERARGAHLIITNHHLLMADASLRLGQRFGDIPDSVELLPEHQALVIDEAHGLRDVATSAFGASLSSKGVERLVRDLRDWIKELQNDDVQPLLDQVKNLERSAIQAMQSIESGLGGHEQRLDPERMSEQAQQRLQLALQQYAQLGKEISQIDADDSAAQALALRLQRQQQALDFVCRAEDSDYVYFVERYRRHLRFVASPIDVAEPLRETIFQPGRSVILTSATLSTDQGFASIREMLGLDEDPQVSELQLASPFPYAELIRYYLPRPSIAPDSSEHLERVAEECLKLCQLSGGGAFLLFTSYRVLDAVYDRIFAQLSGLVLRQGDAPRNQLLEQFRSDGHAILFGTQSFWEGIDVQGSALRLVVIDRLPFVSPADPLHAARSQRIEAQGRRSFTTLSLPQAIMDLKQGVGRLVRSAQDRGVVAILDGRVVNKGYGRRFLRALPKAAVLRERSAVEDFFTLTRSDH